MWPFQSKPKASDKWTLVDTCSERGEISFQDVCVGDGAAAGAAAGAALAADGAGGGTDGAGGDGADGADGAGGAAGDVAVDGADIEDMKRCYLDNILSDETMDKELKRYLTSDALMNFIFHKHEGYVPEQDDPRFIAMKAASYEYEKKTMQQVNSPS